MKKKVISMLALMITISTSAWAQKEVKLTQTADIKRAGTIVMR